MIFFFLKNELPSSSRQKQGWQSGTLDSPSCYLESFQAVSIDGKISDILTASLS